MLATQLARLLLASRPARPYAADERLAALWRLVMLIGLFGRLRPAPGRGQ